MRAAMRASIPFCLVLLVGCGHAEPTVDDGVPSGNGGPVGLGGSSKKNGSSAGGGGAAGAGGGGAGGGSTGNFRSKTQACQALEAEYAGVLPQAQTCDSTAIPSPCVQQVSTEVACPCVTYAVANLVLVEELQSVQSQWSSSTCPNEVDCSKVTCPTAPSMGDSGTCANGVCALP